MDNPADRLHRMLAGLGPAPATENPAPLAGTPFGMTAHEQAQTNVAQGARTASNLEQSQQSPGQMNGNIGGYQSTPQWDVFFNALNGQKPPRIGSGSLLPDSPAMLPQTGHHNGLQSWLSNPLVPQGNGTY